MQEPSGQIRRLGGAVYGTTEYAVYGSLHINSHLRAFSRAHQMEPLGHTAQPRVIYNTPRLGTRGGANGLMPLLPARPCEPDKAIRLALGERNAKECAMSNETNSVGRFGTEPPPHHCPPPYPASVGGG